MELDILRYIQSFSNPILDILFQIFTMLGEQLILTGIFTYIYWSKNKQLGEFLGFSLFSSLCVNGLIKDTIKAPRPIGEEGIRTLRAHTATGYSFPSGHSQTSSTFWTSMYVFTKKRWAGIVGTVIVALVGLSRMYLGVHYPKDVVCGILLGIVLPIIFIKIWGKFENKSFLYLTSSLIALVIMFFAPSRDYLKCFSLLVGFSFGTIIEHKYVNFTTNTTTFKKITRWILGLVFIGLISSLKFILPQGNIFTFIRYSLISFFGVGIYPFMFKFSFFK